MSSPTQPRRRIPSQYSEHTPSVSTREISFNASRESKDVARFSLAATEYSTALVARISQVCDDIPNHYSGKLPDLLNELKLLQDAVDSIRFREHIATEAQMNDLITQAVKVCDQLHRLVTRIESRAKCSLPLPHNKHQTSAVQTLEGGSSSSSYSTEKSVYSQASFVPQQPSELLHIRRKKLTSATLPSSKRNAWFLQVEPATSSGLSSAASNITPRPSRSQAQPVLPRPQHNLNNLQYSGILDFKNVYRNTPSTYYANPKLHPVSENVNMSLPSNQDIIYDGTTGQIKAASFSELVRFLTSWTAAVDEELTTITLTWFREFATPAAFFLELVDLYVEECPANHSLEQTHIWESTAHARRIRIAKVILDWVTKYWYEAEDRPVIVPLRQFLELPEENDPVRHIINRIIHQMPFSEDHPNVLTIAKQRPINVSKKFKEAFPPTDFKLPESYTFPRPDRTERNRINSTEQVISQLRHFSKSKAGLEEFARQLTLIVSAYFRRLQPVQVIEIWRRLDRRDKRNLNDLPGSESWFAIASFGKTLATWVAHTIVVPHDMRTRVFVICFWAEIALRCVAHGNFYGSSSILAGIEYSPVARMKETILAVHPNNKHQLHTLRRIFELSNNSTTYRGLLNQNWAPIILPFTNIHIRDVIATETLEPTENDDYANRRPALIPLRRYRLMMKVMKVLEKSIIHYHFTENEPFIEWFTAQISLFPQQEGRDYVNELNTRSQENERRSPDLCTVEDAWDYVMAGFNKRFQDLKVKERERYIASFLKHLADNKTSDKYVFSNPIP